MKFVKRLEFVKDYTTTRMRSALLLSSILILANVGFGQNALKQKKQQTAFFYTQLNLHGGYIHDVNGGRFDVTNQAPKNQLAFQLFTRNKKLLQKGYVRTVHLNSAKLRFSVPFDKSVNANGNREADFKLQILDTWLKFDTKWDRTSFWIGNKSIPYGHNPKLDPVSSFMTNIIKMDIGFVQDVGIFFKTPIANKLDMELSLTTGGMLNKPVIVCDNLINDELDQSAYPRFSFANYSYENTWLLTSHIGSPTFQKNEFGINVVSGRINNTLIPDDYVQINRIGGDWVHKYKERFKWTNQLTVGHSQSEIEGAFGSLHAQSGIDLFLGKHFFVSSSFACNYHGAFSSNLYHYNFINAQSLTYSFSPHTRIRLNHYVSGIVEMGEKRWGLLLQFVIGFGKRP
ncbi:MAG: hypothetical protein ACI837_002809 [Crocinitomicaceae bacterium]|jgi:hypothetical protein